MKGVYRGGCYISGKVYYTLGDFRGLWTDHYNGAEHIGFRLNGVRRGGVYNDYARYCKSVYRNNYAKANGHREIGFRSEWCNEVWECRGLVEL